MQTFLPYPDFYASAACLDYRRLGKQRVECLQLLKAIETGSGGWVRHPAAIMWSKYPDALRLYQSFMIREWVRRGYVNNMIIPEVSDRVRLPWWLGNPAFHASHRSNLLRKDPAHYGRFGWSEPPGLEYSWPSAEKPL